MTSQLPVPKSGVRAPSAPAPSFKDIQERVRRAGLLTARPGYYVAKVASNALLLAAGWALVVLLGDSWWQLLTAVYLGFCYVQTGLVGHDSAHLQIFRRARASELMNLVHGNLLLGVSAAWWSLHHNRHHSFPNHLGKDPDLLNRPVLFAVDERKDTRTAPRRFLVRHQAGLYFPLLVFDSAGVRVLSLLTLRAGQAKRVVVEAVLIVLHFVAYFAVLIATLSTPLLIAFVVVHHAAFGLYLGAILAPNHKGMPVRDGEDDQLDWVRRQVVTSRNLRSTRLTDFLYGGLNYQIEHHLFPTMPRPNLRRARPIVRQYCHEVDLPYYEVSVPRSYLEVVAHLRTVSRAWRAGR